MALHPAERPQTVELFRQALLGERTPLIQPFTPPRSFVLKDYLNSVPEKYLIWAAAGLLTLSLLITLVH
jgi:hypothetical protein